MEIRIAQECGYASLSNFNRRFFELKGATPSRYRRRIRTEHPAPPGRALARA